MEDCFSYLHAGCGLCLNGVKIISWYGSQAKLKTLSNTILLSSESEEELKSLLIKVKEESENGGLKLNIQKTKIMTSGPNTLWEIDEETVEKVTDFILGGSKITADGDCSHEIKMLAPWKESYEQPRQHIKKQTWLCQQRSV